MRKATIAAAMLLVLGARTVFAGAWPVTHRWNETARPGDPTSGSYAYEYSAASVAAATTKTAAGVKLDCADLAITLLCEYGAKHGLEVSFVLPDPAKNFEVRTVSSNDPRFKSPAQFTQFARDWINAKMVATLNTSSIPRDRMRAGDLFLMRWSQLGPNNPFPGRDVWHTYFVGEPEKLLFYGNDDANAAPLPLTATAEDSRLDAVDSSAAIYEGLARRWKLLEDAIVAPATPIASAPSPLEPERATVTSATLNVRATPSMKGKVLTVARKGATFAVEGRAPGDWVRVRLADGSIAYVAAAYVRVERTEPGCRIVGRIAPAPPTVGLVGGVTGD